VWPSEVSRKEGRSKRGGTQKGGNRCRGGTIKKTSPVGGEPGRPRGSTRVGGKGRKEVQVEMANGGLVPNSRRGGLGQKKLRE